MVNMVAISWKMATKAFSTLYNVSALIVGLFQFVCLFVCLFFLGGGGDGIHYFICKCLVFFANWVDIQWTDSVPSSLISKYVSWRAYDMTIITQCSIVLEALSWSLFRHVFTDTLTCTFMHTCHTGLISFTICYDIHQRAYVYRDNPSASDVLYITMHYCVP